MRRPVTFARYLLLSNIVNTFVEDCRQAGFLVKEGHETADYPHWSCPCSRRVALRGIARIHAAMAAAARVHAACSVAARWFYRHGRWFFPLLSCPEERAFFLSQIDQACLRRATELKTTQVPRFVVDFVPRGSVKCIIYPAQRAWFPCAACLDGLRGERL